jgi:hypothetical protein
MTMYHTMPTPIATALADRMTGARAPTKPPGWWGLFAALAALYLTLSSFNPASAAEDENYKVAQGLGIYLGVLPAGMVRGPDASMHGGVPGGAHEYHIIVAVFDAATSGRVENAKVVATVSGLGHVGENSFNLDPMAIAGTVTYGGFVNLPSNDRYGIAVEISVPGRDAPVRVDFIYEHLGVK